MMRLIAVELPIVAVAVILIASMVLAAGNAIEPPERSVMLPGRPAPPLAESVGSCLAAPMLARSTSDALGQARLCYGGGSLRVTLRVSGLVPGALYTAWLNYLGRPSICTDASCGGLDLPSERSAGWMQRIAEGVATPSRTLDLDVSFPAVEPVSGEHVALVLFRPDGRPDPHAKAAFVIP